MCVQLGTFLRLLPGHRGVSPLAAHCLMRCFPVPVAHSHDPCSAQCGSARCPAVKGGLEFQFTADLWPLADKANAGEFGSAAGV